MIEVFGDATRCGEWASVRLTVDGERIVGADAEGLATDLRGMSLLEAAAVPGDDLWTDALAAAIGPIFRAEPSPTRIAVAMSGGVDSAVALLRAGPTRSASPSDSGSIPRRPTPSAPAARPSPCLRPAGRATRSACRT